MDETKCPCKDCQTRRFYATRFDMHIWGEDCPYICEEYEAWERKKEQEAVRPTILRNGDPPCYCGKCAYPVKGREKFCAPCGKGINWSD